MKWKKKSDKARKGGWKERLKEGMKKKRRGLWTTYRWEQMRGGELPHIQRLRVDFCFKLVSSKVPRQSSVQRHLLKSQDKGSRCKEKAFLVWEKVAQQSGEKMFF